MYLVTRVKNLVTEIDATNKRLKELESKLRDLIRSGGERVAAVAITEPKKRKKMSLKWRRAIGQGISKAHKQRKYRLTVPVVPAR